MGITAQVWMGSIENRYLVGSKARWTNLIFNLKHSKDKFNILAVYLIYVVNL